MLSQNLPKHKKKNKKTETNKTFSKQTTEATSLMWSDWQLRVQTSESALSKTLATNRSFKTGGWCTYHHLTPAA